MAIYTYKDFEQAAKNAGLLGQFSKADLTLAQQNPDAGMSILKYKQDFANATTDAQRAAANSGAEAVRSSWGGYTGGGDGGSFHLDAMSPNDYKPSAPAPSFTDTTTAPTYTNRYDEQYRDLLDQIVNRPEFKYDAETDPLYSQYRKQYAREGERATQDTLAAAAAATGGLPSSYAVTAAGQAGNYYASQMTDKMADLYQLAYNKYVSDHSMKQTDLDAIRIAEQSDYQKFLNDQSQYNTDRNFLYNQYLNDLNQYNTDRNFNYSQFMDEINNQTLSRQEQTAMSESEWQREYEIAQLAAAYGDYSGLQKLGINPNIPVTSGSSSKQETDPVERARIYGYLIDKGYSSADAKYMAEGFATLAQAREYFEGTTPEPAPEPELTTEEIRRQQTMKLLGISAEADKQAQNTAMYNQVLDDVWNMKKDMVSKEEAEKFLNDAVAGKYISSASKTMILREVYGGA